MSEPELTPEETTLVRQYVDIPPGLSVDRQDVTRARLAEAAGGHYRKVGPGLYEVTTKASPDNH
ncbi:hypothetical protein [Kitasatospora sp. DSM 101779]|uniref:hypothetical protein n=1 Tax=Kitasatospora sp. DSM 101779 TaxID=2853165 RepID=UPI0021D7FAEF|nr:hypothetical protein [Kitasatospora sp. DSM 101779]MCU7827063.1 hypothetical protein [Kitasatospora sp. DSM 101779]